VKAELVLNDLSICEAASQQEARAWLSSLMETVADLIDEDVCMPVLHANLNLYELDLLPDEYGFREWVEDPKTDFELRQLAWTLSTRTPVREGLPAKGEDEFLRSEFKLSDDFDCIALGVALLHDGIAVSLPSSEIWRYAQVFLTQYFYDEGLENPREVPHQIRHASLPEHVDSVIRNWRHGLGRKITSVHQLVAQWETAFPYLDKCVDYEKKMLPKLEGEVLRSALERLWQLDEACHHWDTAQNSHPPYPMEAHPETSETLRMFGEYRLSTCPHQGGQHFEMHCRIQPTGYRLYWLVNRKMQRVTIGYIGPHLPTKKYPKGM
jgi:hypothetical protein